MNKKEAELATRQKLKFKHYAWDTERNYIYWLNQYMDWLIEHRPSGDSTEKLEKFLTWLVVERDVAAATQNQAFNALLFFYRYVKKEKLNDVQSLRSKQKVHKRHAPSVREVKMLFDELKDTSYPIRLVCQLLYGCGLRVNEALSLRLKDVRLDDGLLVLREPKHGTDRFAKIPVCLLEPLRAQAKVAVAKQAVDRANGLPVQMPHAYGRRSPGAAFSWGWAFLFPLHKPSPLPRDRSVFVRYHMLDTYVQNEVRRAAKVIGLDYQLSPHCLRHAYATHLSRSGADARDIQASMGHKCLETTMGYIHPEIDRLRSPLDAMQEVA